MSIFSAIGRNFISPIIRAGLQAVAPAASNLLKNVAGDLFSAGAGALKLGTFALPGPVGRIARNLIDAGVNGAQNYANFSIDSALARATGSAHVYNGEGFSTVLPNYTSRSSTSYASGATVGNYGESVGNYGSGNNIGTAGASSGIAAMPNLNTTPTDQIKAELKAKYPNLKPEDLDMMAAQEAEQRYNRMISLLTQLLTMKHEATKSIIQNFRA